MTHDERTSGDTNEQSQEDEACQVVYKTSHCRRNRRCEQDESHRQTGPKLISDGSEEETAKDVSRYGHNVGGPDILLAQLKSVFYSGEERCDGEPNEKGNEKGPPGIMKCAHVGASKAKNLKLCSLVGGVYRQGKLALLNLIFVLIDWNL